jgi:hypothetical protein
MAKKKIKEDTDLMQDRRQVSYGGGATEASALSPTHKAGKLGVPACLDCRFCAVDDENNDGSLCDRLWLNPVTGLYAFPTIMFCGEARKYTCGYEGRFFEPVKTED